MDTFVDFPGGDEPLPFEPPPNLEEEDDASGLLEASGLGELAVEPCSVCKGVPAHDGDTCLGCTMCPACDNTATCYAVPCETCGGRKVDYGCTTCGTYGKKEGTDAGKVEAPADAGPVVADGDDRAARSGTDEGPGAGGDAAPRRGRTRRTRAANPSDVAAAAGAPAPVAGGPGVGPERADAPGLAPGNGAGDLGDAGPVIPGVTPSTIDEPAMTLETLTTQELVEHLHELWQDAEARAARYLRERDQARARGHVALPASMLAEITTGVATLRHNRALRESGRLA